MPRITVFVADDHPVFREAVCRAVSAHPALELAGSSGDGGEALAQLRALEPDVALLDYLLPTLDGLEILRAIRREASANRVVILTGMSTSETVYEAISLGASGFLTKAATMAEICDTLVAVAAGETVLAATVQSGLVKELRARETGVRQQLSERESEILRLIAAGLTSPEIGERLAIAPSTVKSHVQSMFGKLGVSDRAAAVAEAMRRGLLE